MEYLVLEEILRGHLSPVVDWSVRCLQLLSYLTKSRLLPKEEKIANRNPGKYKPSSSWPTAGTYKSRNRVIMRVA